MGSEAKSSSSLHQTNVWPDATVWGEEEVAFFKKSIEEYYCGLCKVAECVLQAICEGITANDPRSKTPLEAIMKTCNDSNKTIQSHTSILTLLGCEYLRLCVPASSSALTRIIEHLQINLVLGTKEGAKAL